MTRPQEENTAPGRNTPRYATSNLRVSPNTSARLRDLSGERVLEELRQDARTAHVPVVVLSADATEAQVKRLLARGADAYLTKPLDVPRLLEVLEQTLDGKRQAA